METKEGEILQGKTIAAIATPHGEGGIGVIRISGEGAFSVADAIFHRKSGKSVGEMPGYTAAYGEVHDAGGKIDEAVVLVFHATRSYTGEDVVEISCHGGEVILRRALAAALAAGAQMAQPGEFTKRAFLNGRIGLTEAESVMELIGARNVDAANAALARHEGALHRRIQAVKEDIYQLSAEMAAYFDYPDEDIPALSPKAIANSFSAIDRKLLDLCGSYEMGKVVREGVAVAIVGKPNVGKSTLMNRLLGVERSIVTEIAGTTRDVVEETVRFAGTTLHLSDTAGLHATDDPVERIGVERAREKMGSASIVFAVFDGSRPLDAEDEAIFDLLCGKQVIALLNKADLQQRCDARRVRALFPDTVSFSATDAKAMDILESCVRDKIHLGTFDPRAGILANVRQLGCAMRAKAAIEDSRQALDAGFTLDAVSTGLRDAADALAELTGEQASEAVIDKVFAQFCVGK